MPRIDLRDDDATTTEALRRLIAREAERPLSVRVPADHPAHEELVRLGFVEHGRDGDGVVYVLPPTLE